MRYTLERLGTRTDGDPYGAYHLILRPGQPDAGPTGTLVGVGGSKGPPDARGEVELGYSVLGDFQRRGYAREAVRRWLALAFADPRVQTVVGQTLASLQPSIGVLERAGSRLAGTGNDAGAPAGERVLRYELARGAYVARACRRVDTDSLYIDLAEQPSVESREISEGIVLDYDAVGNHIAIDIDNASRKVRLQHLELSGLAADISHRAG